MHVKTAVRLNPLQNKEFHIENSVHLDLFKLFTNYCFDLLILSAKLNDLRHCLKF